MTDPVKRSEAISGIVKSISVIPNQITRDTYLHECALRLGMSEATLVGTMNRFISGAKEEQAKEAGREERRLQREGGDGAAQPATIGLHSIDEQAGEVERMLISEVIRHGEETIFEGLETDDGQTVNLSVAQYIDYDLAQDGISFANETYNRILAEAAEHSGEEGFKAESYFLHHPDADVSRVAGELAIVPYRLCRSLEMEHTMEGLRLRVTHLVLDLRMDITQKHIKDVKRRLLEAGSDMAKVEPLMREYKEAQQLRNILARRVGNDIVS